LGCAQLEREPCVVRFLSQPRVLTGEGPSPWMPRSPTDQHDGGRRCGKEIPMATTKREKNVGLTLAAAGAGIMGAAAVFGLTTDSGAIDWVGIVTATAGLMM